jgi:hypothetical protein
MAELLIFSGRKRVKREEAGAQIDAAPTGDKHPQTAGAF